MAVATAQGPKKTPRKRGPRIWIEATRLEQKAVRAVARAEGLARGAILRRYSLDQILAKYEALTNGK